jgi:quercetin dioxygenase-like cupin family protein
MTVLDPRAAARAAVAASPSRPATAVLLDTPDVRLVVFRIAPGQAVPPHRSPSSVTLSVLEGSGTLSGGDAERRCAAGDVVAYAPEELHGMRAEGEELLLLATIAPRPAERPASSERPAVVRGA